MTDIQVHSPPAQSSKKFTDASAAVEQLITLYERNTAFLRGAFKQYLQQDLAPGKYRSFYPEIRFRNSTFARVDSRLSYGHVDQPGLYSTTITHPQLFKNYLLKQLALLIENHKEPVEIGESDVPIPLHFALEAGSPLAVQSPQAITTALRDTFDVPDIAHVNDYIVNGTQEIAEGLPMPLAPFPAQRIDYSLHRLVHYSSTDPEHFQNYVLFTNYQFYKCDDEGRRIRAIQWHSPPS